MAPGHLVFLYTISCMQGGHTSLTLVFIVFYMTAALLQVRPGRSWGGGVLPPALPPLPLGPGGREALDRGSGGQSMIPAESRTGCVTLAQSLYFSEPLGYIRTLRGMALRWWFVGRL